MACCLTAPSHDLNQWWLISEVLLYSPEGKFHRKCLSYQLLKYVARLYTQNCPYLSGDNEFIFDPVLMQIYDFCPMMTLSPMICLMHYRMPFNILWLRQNGRHFADIFKCIFRNENVWIPIKMSLKFVPKGPDNDIPVLVQIMVWRRPGEKPLSEMMMVSLPTHICVTRPQWVKKLRITVLYPVLYSPLFPKLNGVVY